MNRAGCATLSVFALALALSAIEPYKDDAKDQAWVTARRNFWSFQTPKRTPVPDLRDPWVRTPIDAFLLEAMRAKGVSPSHAVDKRTLVRRVTLDLTGLPPTPGEVDLFLRDTSADAYEKLVDRLLASPQYGVRWAQRWLDVVRYADTNGFELDVERPHAWRYRDYVVNAFNHDKPFDRFVQEQIAGDELFPGNPEALIATGFHRAGPIHLVGGNQDEEMNRQEVLTEMATGVASVFLGLTMQCARCHNHKFDPIPQADYYRLQSFFSATKLEDIVIASDAEKKAYDEALKVYKARRQPIEEEIKAIEKPYRARLREAKLERLEDRFKEALKIPKDKRNEEQERVAKEADDQLKLTWDEVVAVLAPEDKSRRAGLRRQLHRMDWDEPPEPRTAYAVADMEEAPPTYILKVGDYRHKLSTVEPAFPIAIPTTAPPPPSAAQGRRSALAKWLTAPGHPLTARVMVNRIWQFRMGTGLVRTPNDFGMLGERPTNQQLLDWLTTEFQSKGWSVKTIDRLIVLSSVYRQSASRDAAKSEKDPDNKLYWRMNHRRLEGEAIRDSLISVSGNLNPQLGGKPIRIPIEKEVYDIIFTEFEPDNLWPVHPDKTQHDRRSLYLLNKRTVRLPFFANFDQPDAMTSCPVRPVSTHALQALSLMNSDMAQEQAQRFAARLERECGAGNRDCEVRRAYSVSLARPPKAEEITMAEEFFAGGGPLEDFALALMNRHEFVYIP